MSAMVAYPSAGLPSNPSSMFHNLDTASLNGHASSSGCHSQGDDNPDRSRSSSPISLGAFSNYIPKNGGQLIRNRIFVCGFGNNTAEDELRAFFEQYGNVKDVKVIADKTGSSKGYGFVTFESEEEAKRIIKEEQNNNKLNFKDRTLNIGPAIKREVARSTGLAINQVLSAAAAAAAVPELTTGPALYYQSPAALAQVLLPSAAYPAIAAAQNVSLAVDSNSSTLPYGTFTTTQQTPVQYAVVGNQLVNYATAPIYASASTLNPATSPYIDSKYVANALSGSTNGVNGNNNNSTNNGTNDCYSTAAVHQSVAGINAQPAYTAGYSVPHASLSAIYAANNAIPTNDMMYYGRNSIPQSNSVTYATSNAASSLSSSVDSTFPALQSAENVHQLGSVATINNNGVGDLTNAPSQFTAPYCKIGAGNDAENDLSQAMSSMTVSNSAQDIHANNENINADLSTSCQTTPYAPQMYNSVDLATAAAAAAAFYQQNAIQQYAKSLNYMKPQPQAPLQQPVMLAAAAAYGCKGNGSPATLRQTTYK